MIRVKVCCIASVEEAWMAIRAGAHAIGLVSAMPSGPGVIDEAVITKIAATIPPPIATFLLTSSQDPGHIIGQQRRCGTNTIQLVDSLDRSAYRELRAHLAGINLVQVIHVRGEAAITEAADIAPHVDALLLDSGNPDLAVKELGGTGRTHNWEISREIVKSIDRPVFLAGGLRVENVASAIETVRPFGVDLCSGVRTAGVLDAVKLTAFMQSVTHAEPGHHLESGAAISMKPIGVVHNNREDPIDDDWDGVVSEIILADELDEAALIGIETYSHVEVVFFFDRVDEFDITIGARHPRGNKDWPLTGIFAQRGKNRPNRLGVSTARIVGRDGRVLRVAGLDAIDGTPVLDLKPVMAEFLPRGEVIQPPWSHELMRAYW